jgi:selenocysteine lyase/cysteine desulfurase
VDKVVEFIPWYSSIQRGSGYKSRVATNAHESARRAAGEFVGYDPERHVVIFGKNASEAMNKLSSRLDIPDDAIIIISGMEHHSNDLPWRGKGRTLFAPVNASDGVLDLDRLRAMVSENRDKLFLVCVTGASNFTGNLNRLHEIAEMTHAAGAYLAVDGAQLAPHRQVRMGKPGEPDSIDFLGYAAHKMYAPFGTGVLVARRDMLKRAVPPEHPGGGTIKLVTHGEVLWADDPEIDEAGSPNVVGAIALAEAISFFRERGFGEIERIENGLARKLLRALAKMPQVEVYGLKDPENFADRLAIVSFNVKDVPHALVAAILGYEYGIGIRSGNFCAHPYVNFLLDVVGEQELSLMERMRCNDRSCVPGAVRVAFGFYNVEEEVDCLIEAVERIVAGEYSKCYALNTKSGEYKPEGFVDDFSRSFALRPPTHAVVEVPVSRVEVRVGPSE